MRYTTLFLLFWLISSLPARAEYFVIKQFDIGVRIDREGWFEVEETIDVAFSSERHGIFRYIPFYYQMEGRAYHINIYDLEVEGWPWEKSWENGNVMLKIGDADRYVNGAQRYIVRYKVQHAFLYEKEHTEFYWNLTGNEWPVEIQKVNFRIETPGGVDLGPDDYRVFTGAAGEQGHDAAIRYRGGMVYGSSTRVFSPNEGLTVAIRLPLDALKRPSAFQQGMRRHGALSIPALLLLAFTGLFLRYGRDPSVVKMPVYYPPDNFSPAEAGAFIDDKVDNRDLISLIPYWAGQGYIRIREIREKVLIIFSDTDFEFTRLKDLPPGRPDYEYTLFNGLFSSGDTVEIGDLKDQFYTTMSSARSQLEEAIKSHNLYTAESRKWRTGVVIASIVAFPLGFFLLFSFQFAAGAALIAVGILGLILQKYMLKKNKEGLQLYQQLAGFRMFVDRADRERIERLLKEDGAYFEKTLPFAIAFGMGKQWSKEFEGLFTEPPSWYVGAYGHGPYRNDHFSSFASNFESNMREVQSVFTSSPSSSGSGGGSSGGGFGGGGGGSW